MNASSSQGGDFGRSRVPRRCGQSCQSDLYRPVQPWTSRVRLLASSRSSKRWIMNRFFVFFYFLKKMFLSGNFTWNSLSCHFFSCPIFWLIIQTWSDTLHTRKPLGHFHSSQTLKYSAYYRRQNLTFDGFFPSEFRLFISHPFHVLLFLFLAPLYTDDVTRLNADVSHIHFAPYITSKLVRASFF